jgi:predicted nucleic acid-binding protein
VVPKGDEAQILYEETRDSLEPDALEKISPWLHDLAVRAEHNEWMQIVEFTKKRGRSIAREENLSSDAHWLNTREYAEVAAFVTGVLLRDCVEQTH